MSDPRAATHSGEGSLWLLSLLASLVLNALLFFSFSVIASKRVSVVLQPTPVPASVAEQVASIVLMPERRTANGGVQPQPALQVPPRPAQFARTSEDQASARPEKPAFIGERDTEATSDRAPDPTAQAMPSQSGIDPVRSEVETTESRYKEGEIGDEGKSEPVAQATPPAPEAPMAEQSPPSPEKAAEPDVRPGPESMPAPREQLAQGPNPVEVPVAADPEKEAPKPTPANRATEAAQPKPPAPQKQTAQETPKEASPAGQAPGFKGYQRKTQIQGSISRTGKSALAVENSAMGRYQAALSRAVEQEWQRNCVRYRDYITPGFLTVRFVVEQNGKVRSVAFVGAMQSGEVQKGFTLNAIRQAEIPAMPADLKKELGTDPLELIFNFYF